MQVLQPSMEVSEGSISSQLAKCFDTITEVLLRLYGSMQLRNWASSAYEDWSLHHEAAAPWARVLGAHCLARARAAQVQRGVTDHGARMCNEFSRWMEGVAELARMHVGSRRTCDPRPLGHEPSLAQGSPNTDPALLKVDKAYFP